MSNTNTLYKVIVAEDEELILNNLTKKIHRTNLGFEVIATAQDGKSALALVEKYSPDLLITDIRMPIMDGMELLKNVSIKYPYIEKLIISGYGEFEYAQQALKYQVKDYLLKPIKFEALIESLNNIRISIDTKIITLNNNKIPIKKNYDYSAEQMAHLVELYIRENFTREINLDMVAQNFNFNSSYLSKIFTKFVGENPSKYVKLLRINKAKHLLINNTDKSIKEIGIISGYEDQFYFSRIFKNVTGESPASFRNTHTEKIKE